MMNFSQFWGKISNYGPGLLFWSWKKSLKFMALFFWLPVFILFFPVIAAFSFGSRFSFWGEVGSIAYDLFMFLIPTTFAFLIFCISEKAFSHRRLMAFLSGTGVFLIHMGLPRNFDFHIIPILLSVVYGGVNAMLCLETYENRHKKKRPKRISPA